MKQKPKTLVDLEKAYKNAVKDGVETFSIDGFDFVTSYVKYVLEYIKEKGVWNMDAPLDSVFRGMKREE